jgi:hypothetical protein
LTTAARRQRRSIAMAVDIRFLNIVVVVVVVVESGAELVVAVDRLTMSFICRRNNHTKHCQRLTHTHMLT